jgi:hypothetical protein
VTDPRLARREWDVAVSTGLLRIAAGAALWRGRRTLPVWVGAARDDRAMQRLFTYFAVRDTAVGVAALAATRPGSDVSRQLVVQGAADTTDALLVAAALRRGHLPRGRGLAAIALAAGTAAAEYAGALALRRSR